MKTNKPKQGDVAIVLDEHNKYDIYDSGYHCYHKFFLVVFDGCYWEGLGKNFGHIVSQSLKPYQFKIIGKL